MNISNAITTVITISLVSVLTIFSIFASPQSSSFMIKVQAQSEYGIMSHNIVNKYESKDNSAIEQSNLTSTKQQPIYNNGHFVWYDTNLNQILFPASNNTNKTFNTPVKISNDRLSFEPLIASSGDNVYVVWVDYNNNTDRHDIFFTASNDSGKTFTTPLNLSNNTDLSYRQQISAIDNHVYVVWEDYNNNNNTDRNDVLFTASNDSGKTFTTPKILSNNTDFSFIPLLSAIGNNVYVVWIDEPPNISEHNIFFTASNDNGQTFSTPIKISNDRSSFHPQISAMGINVYVVWNWEKSIINNIDIFFTASNDSGKTFTTPKILSNNTDLSFIPLLSAIGNNVYVVWADQTFNPDKTDIFFTKSNDTGNTFSSIINLSNNTKGTLLIPQISSIGNSVYVVWKYYTVNPPYIDDIFFTASNDTGNTFSIPKILSNIPKERLSNPLLSAIGNNVYVVWIDEPPNISEHNIFFTASNDNGQTFSTPIKISNDRSSSDPRIYSSGNNVYVIWIDYSISSNKSDVYFTVSNNTGKTFSTPINLSNNTE